MEDICIAFLSQTILCNTPKNFKRNVTKLQKIVGCRQIGTRDASYNITQAFYSFRSRILFFFSNFSRFTFCMMAPAKSIKLALRIGRYHRAPKTEMSVDLSVNSALQRASRSSNIITSKMSVDDGIQVDYGASSVRRSRSEMRGQMPPMVQEIGNELSNASQAHFNLLPGKLPQSIHSTIFAKRISVPIS